MDLRPLIQIRNEVGNPQELLVEHGQQFNKMEGLVVQMTGQMKEQVRGVASLLPTHRHGGGVEDC